MLDFSIFILIISCIWEAKAWDDLNPIRANESPLPSGRASLQPDLSREFQILGRGVKSARKKQLVFENLVTDPLTPRINVCL